MNQLNHNQIERIKAALIELDDYDFNTDEVALTGQDWDEWFEDSFGGVTHEEIKHFVSHSGRVVAKTDNARKIEDYQYQKGDTRITIYVINLGDLRVVFEA